MTIVEMCVHMDCAGCESKIRKAIRKLHGVDSVDVDMARQKVTVTGSVDQKKVLKAVRKTGRRAVLWTYPFDGENYVHMYGGGSADQHYNYGHPALAQHQHLSSSFRGNPSSSSSSYNYYKHGYVHGPSHSAAMGERAGDAFSDENPNACSVM